MLRFTGRGKEVLVRSSDADERLWTRSFRTSWPRRGGPDSQNVSATNTPTTHPETRCGFAASRSRFCASGSEEGPVRRSTFRA